MLLSLRTLALAAVLASSFAVLAAPASACPGDDPKKPSAELCPDDDHKKPSFCPGDDTKKPSRS